MTVKVTEIKGPASNRPGATHYMTDIQHVIEMPNGQVLIVSPSGMVIPVAETLGEIEKMVQTDNG